MYLFIHQPICSTFNNCKLPVDDTCLGVCWSLCLRVLCICLPVGLLVNAWWAQAERVDTDRHESKCELNVDLNNIDHWKELSFGGRMCWLCEGICVVKRTVALSTNETCILFESVSYKTELNQRQTFDTLNVRASFREETVYQSEVITGIFYLDFVSAILQKRLWENVTNWDFYFLVFSSAYSCSSHAEIVSNIFFLY